jgi:hypothetical protein
MVNVAAHSAQSGAHGGAALTDKTSEKKLSADAKESSCVFMSARKPSFLKLPGFPIVPPLGLHRRHAANQNDQNPFHQIPPRFAGRASCACQKLSGERRVPS